MIGRKYTVALIFPPHSAYSRQLTDGIMEQHLEHRGWTVIELPRLSIGRSPLPTGRWHLDGALIWAEPRDLWVRTLLDRQVKVVSFGGEWAQTDGVASVMFRVGDLHREVISHFRKLGVRHGLVLAHRLDKRPATRMVLEAFAMAAGREGIAAKVADIGGTLSPGTSPQRLLKPENEHELAALLAAVPKPAGIFCGGDHIGFIVCEVAARLGLRIPEEIAVVGEGGNLVGAFAHPPLSTVIGPAGEAGRAMADCLATWLAQGVPPAYTREIPGATLVKRESSVGTSGSATLEAVRRAISQGATTGVSLGQLTQLSGLGTKTLIRRYRSSFGRDPVSEIHDLRLAEAKRLLTTPRMTVAEVSMACGFSSQAGFYNYFKRHTGIAPSEFRAAAKMEPD